MAYLELFERVADHVRRQGVKVRFKRGKPLSAVAIDRARSQAFIPIPTALAEFYAEIGDGLEFGWSMKRGDKPLASHEIFKIADIAPKSFEDVNWLTEWKDDYGFPYTDDPVLAKTTALRMRKWFRFAGEGNGDTFCLDTAADPSPVLFNKHDWYDGGSGDNGHKVADSLFQFYSEWAQVCFQLPSSLYWPSVFRKGGVGIDWSSAEFQEPFRLP